MRHWKAPLILVVVSLLALVSGALVEAQLPRTSDSLRNQRTQRNFLKSARFQNVLTVCPGTTCDYTSVKTAADYACTQTRGVDNEWLIKVFPATYTEVAFTNCAHVLIQGEQGSNDLWGIEPRILNTSVRTGTFLTNEGQLRNLFIDHTPSPVTLTGTTDLILCTGFYSGASDITIRAGADPGANVYRFIHAPGSTSTFGFLEGVDLQSSYNGTNSVFVQVDDGSELRLQDVYMNPALNTIGRGAYANGSNATIRMLRTRIGPVGAYSGASAGTVTVPIENNAGLVVTSLSSYNAAAVVGTVTLAESLLNSPPLSIGGCRVLSGSGVPEGAVTAPVCSIYLRTNGGAGTAFCVKESGSGNTGWVCK